MLSATHERGQGLVEYAFILVFIALVVMTVLLLTGPRLGQVFSDIITTLDAIGA